MKYFLVTFSSLIVKCGVYYKSKWATISLQTLPNNSLVNYADSV